MLVTYKAQSLEPSKYSEFVFSLEQITECPMCKKSISPVHLHSVYKKLPHEANIESHLLCNGCGHSFIGSYVAGLTNSSGYLTGKIISVQPNFFFKKTFDPNIEKLSPQFSKIYNQALAAETSNLDEIAGLGYRKSLEFLIKDFAIHLNPDKEEEIKAKMLAPCIKEYIDDIRIKTLAIKSAWIGNDEAHYIRKQKDRDINDMKNFIQATLYFISMVLITEDAETIEPQ